LENGLIVSVTNQQKAVSIWAFMDAFTWQLWVVIIVTCLLVGLVIFGIDAWLIGAKVDKKKKKIVVGNNENCEQEIAFADYIWDAMMRPMQVRDMRPLSTFASNFVVLAFAFMMLVVVTVYTANTTANITATRLQSTIRGVEDLPGKVVGTWEDYVPDLAKVGVTAIGFPWESDEDETAMLEALTNGTIQALVLDNSYLVYVASSSCDIAVVGREFDEKNSAIAFASNIDEAEVIREMNNALSELREDGSQSLLVDTLIEPPEVACKTDLVSGTTTKIGVDELAGLWIMLAVGIVIAVVIVIVYKLHLKYTKKHIDKASKSLKKKMSTTMRMTKQFSSGRRSSFGRSSSLGSSDKGETTKSGEGSDGHEMNTVQENEDVV
jgi:ionotropic glutamate receptor